MTHAKLSARAQWKQPSTWGCYPPAQAPPGPERSMRKDVPTHSCFVHSWRQMSSWWGVCVCNLSSHLLTACAGQQLLGLRASFRSLCFCPQGAHTLWPWKSSLEEGTGGGLTQASPSCLSPLLHCSCLNLLFSPFFPLCSPPFAAVHAVESKWPLGAGCPPRIGGWCVDGSGSGTCPGPAPV